MKPDITDKAIAQSPRLLDQVRAAIRVRHYSIRTEQAYVHWISAFMRFHRIRHIRWFGAREGVAYCSPPDVSDLGLAGGGGTLQGIN